MYDKIKKDPQIIKFCFYGFFKNLKFFEPYLLIYLIALGSSLFHIGVLFAIREIIVYIFEVPSGIIADHFGKKKELILCFAFYIVSFVFFFLGTTWSIYLAMIFFGLGEAFRSGTHKAMIISYLEHMNWDDEKTFVYGRTRSFSLLGSALSSLFSILLILNISHIRFIFLIAIIPYIADMLLILSYPDSLDEAKGGKMTLKEFKDIGVGHIKSFKGNKELKKVVVSSALYDGIFKTIKDYIQPVMLTMILTVGSGYLGGFDHTKQSEIILGIMYFFFYICSSYASRNLYKLTKRVKHEWLYNGAYLINGILCALITVFIVKNALIGVLISFLLLYVLKDGRRPLFVELSARYMKKSERATVLSMESQIAAIIMVVAGPLLGFIADTYSISGLFIVLSVIYIGFYLYSLFSAKGQGSQA